MQKKLVTHFRHQRNGNHQWQKYFLIIYCTYTGVEWLVLTQFSESTQQCWVDMPAQVFFSSLSGWKGFNNSCR